MYLTANKNNWLMMIAASLFLGFMCCQTVYGSSNQAKITVSAVESLRDHGTYIIHFNSTATESELKQFVADLEENSKLMENFTAEVIEKFFIIKCLTAKLSEEALQWVRI